jgi:hypothetical protein
VAVTQRHAGYGPQHLRAADHVGRTDILIRVDPVRGVVVDLRADERQADHGRGCAGGAHEDGDER